jgi:sugar phosphate isomerase/epimerase
VIIVETRKRTVIFLLVIFVIFSAGCTKGTEEKPGQEPEETKLEPLTLRILTIGDSSVNGRQYEFSKIVDMASAMTMEEERRPGHKGFEPTIQDILNIGRIAKEMGMSLLYHNHDFEFVTIDGKYALDILYETIPADILQSEIDTCWVHFAGVNPVEYLKKFKGRAPVVHLKDFTADDTSSSDTPYDLIMSNAPKKTREESHFKFQPLGYGKQDIPSLLEACEYVGAKYVIVEQDVSTARTGLEDAEISRNTLKKYGW